MQNPQSYQIQADPTRHASNLTVESTTEFGNNPDDFEELMNSPDQIIIKELVDPEAKKSTQRYRKWILAEVLAKSDVEEVCIFIEKRTRWHLICKIFQKTEEHDERKVYEAMDLKMRIQHPFLLRNLHYFEKSKAMYYFTELCPFGSLHALLEERGHLHEVEAVIITKQLLNYLLYARQRNVMHLGITLKNLLISEEMEIQLSSFRHITTCLGGDVKRSEFDISDSIHY